MKFTQTPDGIVIHSAAEYDRRFMVRARGRERAFRQELVERARLAPGESVLDVGCGTGTLALAAKRRVGAEGIARGIDPSTEMIARRGARLDAAGSTSPSTRRSFRRCPSRTARSTSWSPC
jgi:ubiquinone/menaquinone biosynthesis C-methylase UbiE